MDTHEVEPLTGTSFGRANSGAGLPGGRGQAPLGALPCSTGQGSGTTKSQESGSGGFGWSCPPDSFPNLLPHVETSEGTCECPPPGDATWAELPRARLSGGRPARRAGSVANSVHICPCCLGSVEPCTQRGLGRDLRRVGTAWRIWPYASGES